jgi:1-phosphatidylinositol phosphodiesterase
MKKFTRKNILLLSMILLMFAACQEPQFNIEKSKKLLLDEFSDTPSKLSISYTSSNWMSAIDGNLTLSEISIPGTHDSGARFEPFSGTAKCQNLTISDQLTSGIRFLDIRCRHVDNQYAIHHGSIYQNLNFNDVVNACKTFLNTNSSECIIMCVKEEHTPSNNNRSFEQTFDWYVQQNPTLWHLNDRIPVLNNVRGKIVLLRRFGVSSAPKGIDTGPWLDNTTFEINNDKASFKIHDQYQVPNNNNKWNAVNNLLNEAPTGNPNRLYLTFTSGYKPGIFGIPNINTVSNFINPKITTYFTAKGKGRFGIVVMDFAESTKNNLIIKTNFQ